MRLMMIEILIMSFGGFLFNPHYLHTLMHDVIKTHYELPKTHNEMRSPTSTSSLGEFVAL